MGEGRAFFVGVVVGVMIGSALTSVLVRAQNPYEQYAPWQQQRMIEERQRQHNLTEQLLQQRLLQERPPC